MQNNLFLYLGIIFAAAYVIKVITKKFKIPEVTGYVLLGVLLGPSILKFLNTDVLGNLSGVSSIALGIIAFIIGIELKFDVIKRLGKAILFIVLFESIGTFILVTFAVNFFFPGNIQQSILLGSVASATAPAATVSVIRQYKTKGNLTSTILAVVGIDDAIALIIYVFASGFVKDSLAGADIKILSILLSASFSILISFALGLCFSFLYVILLKKIRNSDWIEILLAAFIFLILGLCEFLKTSELLAIMVFGAFVVNNSPALSKKSEIIVDGFSPVFLAAFFILGGARLDISVFLSIGFMGLIYFLSRSIGKIGFASLGALIGNAPKKVKKYIGFALLPQVGVALALALSIDKDFNTPQYGNAGAQMAKIIINILLFTTIITEIAGPILTRTVLKKAGELEPDK